MPALRNGEEMLPIEKNREENQKRARLRLYKEHLGYLDPLFLKTFQETCEIPRINRWICQKVQQEFKLTLKGKADIEKWNQLLAERFYENPVEWVKEMMRREMYPSTEENMIALEEERQ